MSEIKITVTAPDISEAMKDLAAAIRIGKTNGATASNTTSVIANDKELGILAEALTAAQRLFTADKAREYVAYLKDTMNFTDETINKVSSIYLMDLLKNPNPTNPNSVPQTATVADTQTNVSYHSETPVNPAPVAAAVPVAPANGQAIPTAAPQYTLEMIAKAGTALIDAGKMNELTALLAKYGVEALTVLDPAHYGTFANELRALGASI